MCGLAGYCPKCLQPCAISMCGECGYVNYYSKLLKKDSKKYLKVERKLKLKQIKRKNGWQSIIKIWNRN